MTTRSGSSPRPDDLALDDLAGAGAEREVLEAFLDQQRRAIVRKVADLSEEQARRRRRVTTRAGSAATSDLVGQYGALRVRGERRRDDRTS